ncbi:MAG: asparagine synthase-related protein [Acidobacteriota bacterium]
MTITPTWGDALLAFGDASPPDRGRSTAAWSLVLRLGEASLWSQAPTDGWVGHPVRSVVDGRTRVWWLGEAYGPPPSDTTLVALARGDSPSDGVSAADLAGSWLLIAVDGDGEAARWSVVTDRLGTLHAYRLDGPRGRVSTAFRGLVSASRRRLDAAGLAGFFATGFFPGERTALADVRVLRPARRYVFDAGGGLAQVQTLWRWHSTLGSAAAPANYDDAIDAFDERLRAVMADLVATDRVAVPISGGLDSRSTVAVLPDEAVGDPTRVWAFSYGWGRSSIETRIGYEVARQRGLGFVDFDLPAYLLDDLDRVHAAVEGFQDMTQTRQAAVAEWLGERADAVVAAHWGDVWLDAMGVPPDATSEALVDLAMAKNSKAGRGWLLDHLVRPLLDPHDPSAADPEGVVRAQVAAELARVARVDDADLRLKAFKTEQWSFRWTLASLRAYRLGVVPRVPFYDPRLVDFFLGLPADWLVGRRLQRDHLLRYAPDLARVPWQATGLPLAPTRGDRLGELVGRAARKLGRMAIGRTVVERNWERQLRGADRPRRLREILLATGAPHLDVVEPSAVATLLDRFEARPDPATGYTVSMLLTFAVLLGDLGGAG